MKILHTADWHLGKRLERFSRLEEQQLVLQEICEIADDQNADAIIIAGDLFDNFNPGVEAVELFYKTLKKLSADGRRPVIAISGNHDSPSLIDAPDPLARECGIILIGFPKAKVVPFETEHFKITQSAEGFIELKLEKFDYPLRIIHTPYANEVRLKEYLGEDKTAQLNAILIERWKNLADEFCDDQGVNILTTHLYMNRKGYELLEEPDGEKPLKIGNADLVWTDSIPTQIQYTALGHLHAYNNIGNTEKPIVYSSSPLCYSFSEAGQTKYITIINAEPGEFVAIEKIALTKGKKLHRKSFQEIETAIDWLTENNETLVELTLETETFLSADDRRRIYQSHPGIVHLIPKVKLDQVNTSEPNEINLNQNLDILFKEYFKSKNNGQEANDDLLELFNEIKNS